MPLSRASFGRILRKTAANSVQIVGEPPKYENQGPGQNAPALILKWHRVRQSRPYLCGTCQIVSAYCATARSAAKIPLRAMFRSEARFHSVRSA